MMHVEASHEVAAPIERVWAAVVDFDRLEARGRERDPNLTRTPSDPPPGPGTRWELTVPIQKKPRRVALELVDMVPPTTVRLRAAVEGIDVASRLDLAPTATGGTRMTLRADATAQGLGGKLLLKTLALAKPQVEKRMTDRLAEAGRRIEVSTPIQN